MFKNKVLGIITALVLSCFMFTFKVIAADGIYYIGINSPQPQFGVFNFYTNLHISDYSDFPGAVYYVYVKDAFGEWTSQRLTIVPDDTAPDTYHSEIEHVEGAAEVYLFREMAGGRQFLAGVEYDFASWTQGDLLMNDPSAQIPVDTPPPEEPPTGDDDAPPPADDTSSGGTLDDVAYNDRIMDFSALATQFIIGIAIVSSVFLLPYMGILWASGNPENIKKASEWFYSWLTGLIFLLLSGIIIRVIGTDILSLGLP